MPAHFRLVFAKIMLANPHTYLAKTGSEIPGDYAGVVYISLSDSDRETQVKRELHAAGIEYNPYV